MSLIETLKSSDLVWAILAICTIIGLPSFLYTVITGKRKKEFTYAKTTFQLVSKGASTIKGLEMLYGNKPISDMSVTRFTIWNSGTEAITDQDVYSKLPRQPLCIKSTENAQILDYSIIQSSNSDKFKAKMEDKNLTIHFECVEKKDGVVIQVLHTGNADELNPTIGIKGNEKRGMQTYRMKAMIDPNQKKQNKMRVLTYIVFACVCVLGFLFSQYELHFLKPTIDSNETISIVAITSGKYLGDTSTSTSTGTPKGNGIRAIDSKLGGNGLISATGSNTGGGNGYTIRDYIEKYDLYYYMSIACIVFFFFSVLCIVLIRMKEYNIPIPQNLRDYAKVDITS